MLEEKIKEVIEKEVRPLLLTHGGDCEFIEVVDGEVKIRLTGACAACPGAQFTLQGMVKNAIKSKVPEVNDVVSI